MLDSSPDGSRNARPERPESGRRREEATTERGGAQTDAASAPAPDRTTKATQSKDSASTAEHGEEPQTAVAQPAVADDDAMAGALEIPTPEQPDGTLLTVAVAIPAAPIPVATPQISPLHATAQTEAASVDAALSAGPAQPPAAQPTADATDAAPEVATKPAAPKTATDIPTSEPDDNNGTQEKAETTGSSQAGKPAADAIAAKHADNTEPHASKQQIAAQAKPQAEETLRAQTADPASHPSAQVAADTSAQTAATQQPAAHTQLTTPQAASAPATQSPQAVPVQGLAVEIATQARAGNNRFSIRLDPPELGRIDVRLDIDRDGNVTSRLVVDRVETLDILRRDHHALERALNQAGLKTDENSLQFSLRDQGQSGGHQPRQNDEMHQLVIADDETPTRDTVRGYGRMAGPNGGLDIRV